MLRITKEQFRDIYKETNVSEYEDIFYSVPVSDKEYIEKYLPSKLWRLNNLYTIVSKLGKVGNRIGFNMNLAQHKVYAASLKHSRLIILKSRQQGISTLWLVAFFDDCVFYPDFSSGLMAQGADEAETLLKRTKILWDELPMPVKSFLKIGVAKDNTKEFSFTNGSTIFVRTSFRSATLQRLHISEFGKIANTYPEKAKETKTGTLQAIAPGNTAVIESTAAGNNMFKHMWDTAVSYAGELTDKDFLPVFLPWTDDPDCTLQRYQKPDSEATKYFDDLMKNHNIKLTTEQKNFWSAQYRELGKEMTQEYPATSEEAFMKNRDGTYYASLYLTLIKKRSREVANLYDPNLEVQVAVDLGRNDYFVLVFFQTYTDGYRIINDYRNTGHGIQHYCEFMDDLKESLGYDISTIILPHDAEVRDLTSDKTREEAFWDFGYDNTIIVERTRDINNDRELVRQAMKDMFIDPNAQYTIDCFLNYTREWDFNRQVWKDLHCHNEYSHGADAIRQMVRGAETYVTRNENRKSSYRKLYNRQGIDY